MQRPNNRLFVCFFRSVTQIRLAQVDSIAWMATVKCAYLARFSIDSLHRRLMEYRALRKRRNVDCVFQGIVFN
jgi:hypothetical protein